MRYVVGDLMGARSGRCGDKLAAVTLIALAAQVQQDLPQAGGIGLHSRNLERVLRAAFLRKIAMKRKHAPEFVDLDAADIRAVLTRNYVGRLAFCSMGQPEIRPLHYVVSEGRIYGRTAVGAKFAQMGNLPARVAFEVDEIDALFQWKSVIAHGEFTVLSPDGPDSEEWWRAVQLLRRLVKGTFTDEDPVPERDLIFRINIIAMTGRASR